MEYKNDERYWDIKLLNKWFFIAASLWTLSMVWMFIDDNDDEFKTYQTEYYNRLKLKTESKYNALYSEVSDLKKELELDLEEKKKVLESREDEIQLITDSLQTEKNKYAKIDIDFKAIVAEVDAAKYLLEKEKTDHNYSENSPATKNFNKLVNQKKELKKSKETIEIRIDYFNSKIEELNLDVKLSQDKRDSELKRLDLLENQLKSLDRSKMEWGNWFADIFRDLPIVDFLDPKLKVKQTVVSDVKYDVNFAKVATVDRCVSCHMGIEDPEFSDDEQPFTAHPNLDLIGSSSSPHPFNEFGCASCHSGRSRGTSFVSTVHMPNNIEQKKEWEEQYDWHKMHHWLQPM